MKKRILIIDDDQDFINPTKYMLENAGYEVVVARNGKEGLSLFGEKTPDLVLLDIVMPTMDGFEVLHSLRNDFPDCADVPIVMLTAKSDMEYTFQARAFGATEYIVKSIEARELLNRVNEIIS
ncbi:MAG: response regulator [Candidatus Omnitrophica bacterium]|nr:response regulator [Candidatus Omnitrophota bacterium]